MRLAFLFTAIVVSSIIGVFGTPAIRSVHKMQRDQEHDVGRRAVTHKTRSTEDHWVCGSYSSKNTQFGISLGSNQDDTTAAAQKLCPKCDQTDCVPGGCIAFAAGESNRIFAQAAVGQGKDDLELAQSFALEDCEFGGKKCRIIGYGCGDSGDTQ
jgi:hypothetical protein